MKAGKSAKLWRTVLLVSSLLMVMITASMTVSRSGGLGNLI